MNIHIPDIKAFQDKFDSGIILSSADKYLEQDAPAITDVCCPHSPGTVHDYYSEGDYWWPNPENPDGAYMQRDGETNYNNFLVHRQAMLKMSIQVAALASGYLVSSKEVYARKVTQCLKKWFLNPETLMNPHLLYSQAIKGRCTGRGIGIIDTIHLIEVVKSIETVKDSNALSSEDYNGLRSWFADYLEWLTNHEYGIAEREAVNNHGTCWVAQISAFADFTENTVILDYCRKRFKNKLVPEQFAENGSFPFELARTKPYGYSIFNLDIMALICQILSTASDNLFTYETGDGKGIKKGMEFLFPYLKDKPLWPYGKDVMYWDCWPVRQPCLLFCGIAFDCQEYLKLWEELPHEVNEFEVLRNLPVRHPVLWCKK
jgi:hypothetical protein